MKKVTSRQGRGFGFHRHLVSRGKFVSRGRTGCQPTTPEDEAADEIVDSGHEKEPSIATEISALAFQQVTTAQQAVETGGHHVFGIVFGEEGGFGDASAGFVQFFQQANAQRCDCQIHEIEVTERQCEIGGEVEQEIGDCVTNFPRVRSRGRIVATPVVKNPMNQPMARLRYGLLRGRAMQMAIRERSRRSIQRRKPKRRWGTWELSRLFLSRKIFAMTKRQRPKRCP